MWPYVYKESRIRGERGWGLAEVGVEEAPDGVVEVVFVCFGT